jgi:hypothetical protein
MLHSLRLRLVISFLVVVAVALGVAEIIVERTANREFNSYVARTCRLPRDARRQSRPLL